MRVLPLALLLLLAGCAGTPRTVLDDSAADAYAAPEAELDYWDGVAERRVVTNNDALHGLLLVAGADAGDSYEGRVSAAFDRGWLAGVKQVAPANESASVGLIAVAVCDILGERGGLTMRLLGPSPRYCTRELVYREIIPARTENQSLSGPEFVDLVGRIEDALRSDGI